MTKKIVICLFYLSISINQSVAHPGIGLVQDSKGNIFYTDLNHVWKISTDGKRSIAVRDVHTHELYIDEDDNLYGEHEWYNGEVRDTWGNYVWCLNSSGKFEIRIPEVEGFLENNTLVRDPQHNTYWSKKYGNHHILFKQTPDGQIYPYCNDKFSDVRWMYYSEIDNQLYLVDELQIKSVSPTGTVSIIADDLKEAGAPFNGVADRHYIFGIWTDNNQNIYAAIYGSGKVIKVDSGKKIKTIFTSENGWSPCGGLISDDGSLWIMESSKDNVIRISKIGENGSRTVFDH